ncbi:hypothetical protein TraAM80_05194 [Trypanosoma rangeli]|uniref:Uncharacterized protein n=1 Tax=Trypanosoma rangeli TaxID=5698 RepID=A0A3R7KZC5_TRYRA|nr:uncharacterized protein TraAM80_05194 [Trypanosoma rangeli]RNF04414.1 hypothetical protein TraAM80_05194 [Trypanosoma rangeli]|eukprot:RNF04414.1 hypothetical protein TraAM80_05194 [Trypanosoma rangeli]
MCRRLFGLVSLPSGLRGLSGFGSVLGTGTVPSDLMRTLQEELQEEERRKQFGIGETLRNCIGQGNLDHLESPEADAVHLQKLDSMVESFFSRIPLPEDPMKAALEPTEEELKKNDECEVLKEAVREQYQRRRAAKAAEEARLARAMKRYDVPIENEANSNATEHVDTPNDTVELRQQIDVMKRQLAKLEKLLNSKGRSE